MQAVPIALTKEVKTNDLQSEIRINNGSDSSADCNSERLCRLPD
nr:MAG TPA: hypothetical protein [Caudoviricetes sp.]